MKLILALVAFISICGMPKPQPKDLPLFLVGTWKAENKENYESWTATDGRTLKGEGYKMRQGQKIVTEYLSISMIEEKTIYTAIVPGQNNGQPVGFVLNHEVSGKYSFENLQHDFPKKIQYTPMNETTLFVEVLGDNGHGFSYKMTKQP